MNIVNSPAASKALALQGAPSAPTAAAAEDGQAFARMLAAQHRSAEAERSRHGSSGEATTANEAARAPANASTAADSSTSGASASVDDTTAHDETPASPSATVRRGLGRGLDKVHGKSTAARSRATSEASDAAKSTPSNGPHTDKAEREPGAEPGFGAWAALHHGAAQAMAGPVPAAHAANDGAAGDADAVRAANGDARAAMTDSAGMRGVPGTGGPAPSQPALATAAPADAAPTATSAKPDDASTAFIAPPTSQAVVQGEIRAAHAPSDRPLELASSPTDFQAATPRDKADTPRTSADKERIAAPGIDSLGGLHGAATAAAAHAAQQGAPTTVAQAVLGVAVTTPATAPEFQHALGVQVSVLARDGVHHAELHLNPSDMGPISVHIALDGTQAQVDFGAASLATRQIIESGLPELAAALRDAGFTLAGGGVSEHPRERAPQGDGQPGSRARKGRVDGVADASSARTGRIGLRIAQGAVDLYA